MTKFLLSALQSTLLTILRISAQSTQPVWLYIFIVTIKVRVTYFYCHYQPLLVCKTVHKYTVLPSTTLTLLKISARSAQPVWLYILQVAIKVCTKYFYWHLQPLLTFKISYRGQFMTKFSVESYNPPLWRSWKCQLNQKNVHPPFKYNLICTRIWNFIKSIQAVIF